MIRRLPAEWEPQSGIQITFPHKNSDWAPVMDKVVPCFVEIIHTISQYEKVLVVCDKVNNVKPLLKNANQSNLTFFEAESNDTWARDHGGITIDENGDLVMLDFIFNGWGNKYPAEKDNELTKKLFDEGVFKVARLAVSTLVLEGGGIECDGKGTILTTSRCQLSPQRNPHLNKKEIEERFKFWFGADHVLWLEHGYLAGDDTDSHIDTLARFCDPHIIAYVQCKDKNDEHYTELKAMEKELQALIQPNGKPYHLVPLPFPEACYDEDGQRLPATYANFLVLNEAVLVPTYNVAQDAQALEILQTCFPGRKIIGIDCRALILQHGSLHCVTMQFPEGAL